MSLAAGAGVVVWPMFPNRKIGERSQLLRVFPVPGQLYVYVAHCSRRLLSLSRSLRCALSEGGRCAKNTGKCVRRLVWPHIKYTRRGRSLHYQLQWTHVDLPRTPTLVCILYTYLNGTTLCTCCWCTFVYLFRLKTQFGLSLLQFSHIYFELLGLLTLPQIQKYTYLSNNY